MNKILKCKIIIFVLIICTFLFTSCEILQPIDYNVDIAEIEETTIDKFVFSKKKVESSGNKYLTKKDRDRIANEKIKIALTSIDRKTVKAKGLYYPAHILGDEKKFDEIVQNLKKSCINTIVVDIKDDAGQLTAKMDIPLLTEYNTFYIRMNNIDNIMKVLKENNIYVIARVASFRDTLLARKRNDLAIMNKFGYLYRDDTKYAWLNPYNKETWEYLLAIGKGCKELGFDEVQYDYFRFSTDKGMQSVFFTEDVTQGKSKSDILIECAQYLYENLIKEGIHVSIDVFGSIISSYRDQESVGQNYSDLLKYVDYVCPMVYPSHYSNGYYGIEKPDLEPYKIIKSALNASQNLINDTYDTNSHYGIVRPWLQGFTADFIKDYQAYNKKQYEEQIQAVIDAGYEEWLFWNAAGNYKWDAFYIDK